MNVAQKIIEKFGGLTQMSARMSEALGEPVPVTTIQYWGEVGHIPAGRQPDVLKAARFHDIALGPEDVIAA